MSSMRKNVSRVLVDTWLSRLLSVVGWTWAAIWAMIGVVGLFQLITGESPMDGANLAMPLICLGLTYLNICLILFARKRSALLKDFRLYCAVFSQEPDQSIPGLAASLALPVDHVLDRLQAMCKCGYFNGYIDRAQQRMVFKKDAPQGQNAVQYCPGCGAPNAVSFQGTACRYCGSPLHL